MPATAFPDRADLIFTGGQVHTVNEQNDIAEAVAVGGGRILAVGSDAEARALAGAGTRRVELRGRSLLPDLGAAHSDEIVPRMALLTTKGFWGGAIVSGLILAAPFGAVMATVSSYLVVIASGIVRDIYQRFIYPEATQTGLRRLSYAVMVVVGAIGIAATIDPIDFLQQIGAEIVERGRQDATLRGMGTTLTAARSYGRDLLIVHVGDSRAYLYRNHRLLRLTKDHTFVQLLVDRGQLTPEEAARSKARHILTNVLGGSTERVEVDVDLLRLENGDRVLMCSDGLTDLVTDETIGRTLGETRRSADACARLIQLALDGGGHDNVTAVVAAYSIPEDPMSA